MVFYFLKDIYTYIDIIEDSEKVFCEEKEINKTPLQSGS